jgi:hypothetical protein
MKAMFPALNILIDTILEYKGIKFDMTDDASLDYRSIVKYYNNHARLIVWSGASDCTIFGPKEYNYKFRAWHDLHHIVNGYDFSESGEYQTYTSQMEDVMATAKSWQDCKFFGKVLDIEINRQFDFREKNGYFVEDQRDFMLQHLTYGGYYDK